MMQTHSYIRAFDTNRSALKFAYAEEALFSFRVLPSEHPSAWAPEHHVNIGAAQIHAALEALGDDSKFCTDGVENKVHYDVVSLSAAAGGGILLTAHGGMNMAGGGSNNNTNAQRQKRRSFLVSQSFVLHRRVAWVGEEKANANANEGLVNIVILFESRLTSYFIFLRLEEKWPLIAVSHQITIRDPKPVETVTWRDEFH